MIWPATSFTPCNGTCTWRGAHALHLAVAVAIAALVDDYVRDGTVLEAGIVDGDGGGAVVVGLSAVRGAVLGLRRASLAMLSLALGSLGSFVLVLALCLALAVAALHEQAPQSCTCIMFAVIGVRHGVRS